jgi:hypothetical protein
MQNYWQDIYWADNRFISQETRCSKIDFDIEDFHDHISQFFVSFSSVCSLSHKILTDLFFLFNLCVNLLSVLCTLSVKWRNYVEGMSVCLLIHSPDTCSPETVQRISIKFCVGGLNRVLRILFLCMSLECKKGIVAVLNKLSTMPWRYMGEWRYSSTFLDFGTRWRCVVSFTPRSLYPRGNCPRCTLDRRLGGPQRRSGCYREEKNVVSAEDIALNLMLFLCLIKHHTMET